MNIDTQIGGGVSKDIVADAQRFERMGFDGAWTFESKHDPFLPLALAATATKRLQLGTNITVAFGRSPFSVTQVAWDLQHGSGGRMWNGGIPCRSTTRRRVLPTTFAACAPSGTPSRMTHGQAMKGHFTVSS